MEINRDLYKPEFADSELIIQVSQQTDNCDATIQVGQWKKQFHWCVLVKSPFFESLRNGCFMENETGIIQLNVAPPLYTELAIMFLYGKEPKLTDNNISAILDMSEFLMIPNLKAYCVNHIHYMRLTTSNCIKMLELSSLYEFDFIRCYLYIRSHLDDVLRRKEALHLTTESIIELFTDPHLSYVSSEVRFFYLVNWSKESQKNEAAFSEVFACIDFDGMDNDFLEKVFRYPLVQSECEKTCLEVSPEEHRVLIFTKSIEKNNTAWCFDLDMETWCRMETPYPREFDVRRRDSNSFNTSRGKNITGVLKATLPDIYRVVDNESSLSVCIQNLQSKQNTIIKVSVNKDKQKFSCVYINGPICIGVTNRTNLVEKARTTTPLVKSRHAANLFRSYTEPNSVFNGHQSKTAVQCSTLFYGYLESPATTIQPLISIRDSYISSCCLNAQHIAGILSENPSILYIYDIENCHIDIVKLDLYTDRRFPRNRNIWLAPSDEGFILNNKTQAFIISRLHDPALVERYVVQIVDLEYERSWNVIRYYYCDAGKIWLRILKRTREADTEFASAMHEHILEKTSHTLQWKALPLTESTLYQLYILLKSPQVFIVQIHRLFLHCHTSCPHCKVVGGSKRLL